jgi:hypothetical protein
MINPDLNKKSLFTDLGFFTILNKIKNVAIIKEIKDNMEST